MKLSKIFIVSLFAVFTVAGVAVRMNAQELTLVYKDIGKEGYMEPAPGAAGLYFDLFSTAVRRAGMTLRIERYPKARTYELLESGAADLYPSGTFQLDRSEFLFFIPNGLYRNEEYVGLTSDRVPLMSSPAEMNLHNLTWLVELGSTQPKQAKGFGVPYLEIRDISIEKALLLIQAGRPFCYRVIREELDDYLENHGIDSLGKLGIRIHPDCFPALRAPLYFGFSRKSSFHKEVPNPLFDAKRPVSYENFPVQLVKGSVPDRLRTAFESMIADGTVDRLKEKSHVR